MPVNEKYLQQYAGLEVPPEQQESAARTVASAAEDAADARMLLDMLGLEIHRAEKKRAS